MMTLQSSMSETLLKYANKNRSDGFFNDVTITVGTEQFPANRLVLSCFSRFFEGVFKMKMKEQYENVVKVQGVDSHCMRMLIDYIYSGKLAINNDNVMYLLAAADFLQIDGVKRFCFDYFQSMISLENCFTVLSASKLYRNESLTQEMHQYICDNFVDVTATAEFKTLHKDDLVASILKATSSNIQVEETILYQAIVTWTKHAEEARRLEFFDLFRLIKLSNLPRDFLINVVSNEDLVTENALCSKMTMNAFAKLLIDVKLDEGKKKIVSFGGINSGTKAFEVFSLRGAKPELKLPDLPFNLNRHVSLILDDFIYCIGGGSTDSTFTTNKVRKLKLNETTLKWREVAPMNVKKRSMGAAVFGDVLLIAGGYDGSATSNTVEFYAPQWDEWKSILPMNQRRSGNGLVCCRGCVYAVGGARDRYYLSSVEKLSNLKGAWEAVQRMQKPRWRLAVVNCDGKIYAIGGKDGKESSSTLKSVEKYDPDINMWLYVCDMNIERSAHTACVLKGQIYVLGGCNAKNEVVDEIEVYNPTHDSWKIVGRASVKLCQNSIIAL